MPIGHFSSLLYGAARHQLQTSAPLVAGWVAPLPQTIMTLGPLPVCPDLDFRYSAAAQRVTAAKRDFADLAQAG